MARQRKAKIEIPFFEPVLTLGAMFPTQTDFYFKFGGLPWGLPASRWPNCLGCTRPLSLMAQLKHDTPVFDLGKNGRCLYVFHCSTRADFNLPSGECCREGKAAIILEPEDMGTGLTSVPPRGNPPLTEAIALQWSGYVESINCTYNDCFKSHSYDQSEISQRTKIGGVPWWWQGPSGVPPVPPWRFMLQIQDCLIFEGNCPRDELNCPIDDRTFAFVKIEGRDRPDPYKLGLVTIDDDGWHCDMGVMGRSELGYVFVNTSEATPEALFISQSD